MRPDPKNPASLLLFLMLAGGAAGCGGSTGGGGGGETPSDGGSGSQSTPTAAGLSSGASVDTSTPPPAQAAALPQFLSVAAGARTASAAASAAGEKRAILDGVHQVKWVYYTDINEAGGGEHSFGRYNRWYISLAVPGANGLYSLMPIKDGRAGWGTVAELASTLSGDMTRVDVRDRLDRDTSTRYFDLGWLEWVTDDRILEDRKFIQGSNVPIEWYFFHVPDTGRWYIVNAAGYGSSTVLRFGEANGEYDWQDVGASGVLPYYYLDAGRKYVRFSIPLSPANGGQSISHGALRQGDIILSTTSAWISQKIRNVTNSEVSHALLFVGYLDGEPQVIEAVQGGVRMVSLNDALADSRLAVAYRDEALSEAQRETIVETAVNAIGDDYDYWGAARQWYCQDEGNRCEPQLPEGKFFCSSLVIEAYRQANAPLTTDWRQSPQDIQNLSMTERLEYVGHLKY